MEYEGSLFGKIGHRYIPLTMTTEDIQKLLEAVFKCGFADGHNEGANWATDYEHGRKGETDSQGPDECWKMERDLRQGSDLYSIEKWEAIL